MPTMNTTIAAARATLTQLAEGQTSVGLAQVAEALGMRLEALEKVADLAYPLSPGDNAAQCLLRNLGRTLAGKSKRIGLDAARAEFAKAASDSNPQRLLKFFLES